MRLSRQRYRWPAVLAAGVVLAGGGTAYAVSGGEDSPDYRTVKAGRGDVEQTLTLTGLVDAAHRADLAFGTEGTVASVAVSAGDTVKAGQVIATLATESLDAAVTDAVATLAESRAQLESDQNAQSSSVQNAAAGTGDTPSGPDGGTDNGSNGTDPKTAALLKKLRAQQEAVLRASSAATDAIKAAKEALAAQTAACANALGSAAEDATSGDTASDGSASGDPTPSEETDACSPALADVRTKQDDVKQAQDALQKSLEDLSATLNAAVGSATGTNGTGGPARARTTAQSPTSDSSSQGVSPSSSGQAVTATQLASDQARIDQAAADLITARAARARATLRSTRSGKVASLDLAHGDAVTAGTAVAVVIGGDAVTLTGTVTEENVGKLRAGQTARVGVPGSGTTTTGTVTAIGMTADSSTGTTSYPVTVTVEDPAIALPTGSRAQVSIVLATAEDVITLPISAVTRNGDTAVVRIWNGTTLQRTPVTLGAIGASTVAVTDGVEAGQEVVLADKDRAITGASAELNQRGDFGGGPVVFRQGGPGGSGPGAVTFSR